MKMPLTILLFMFVLSDVCFILRADPLPPRKKTKNRFSFQFTAGANTSFYHYYPYSPDSNIDATPVTSGFFGPYYHFKNVAHVSLESRLNGRINFRKNMLFVESGIGFCRRSHASVRVPESFNLPGYDDLNKVVVVEDFIELQFLGGVSFKKASLSAGWLIPVFGSWHISYRFSEHPNERGAKYTGNFFNDNIRLDRQFYSVIAYQFRVEDLEVGPYLGVEDPFNKSSRYYHAGIQVGILKKQNRL